MESSENERREWNRKLWDMIKDIKVAMLTTVTEEGLLRSRPMATQRTEFEGELVFFSSLHSHKMVEINFDKQVNASFVDVNTHTYVSVSGYADCIQDRQIMSRFWHPNYTTWFPAGVADPDLTLLKVSAEEAFYWDPTLATMVQLFSYEKQPAGQADVRI